MDLSDKSNEIIFFMDRSRSVAPIPKGVEAFLEIPKEKRRISIHSSRTIIGRAGSDMVLKDRKVSEEHAAVGYFDGIFFILDMKSKNGTFVNNTKIREHVLKDGDEIRLGDTSMHFYVTGKIHEDATERWSSGDMSVSKMLEMISAEKDTKFDDPTRIVIEGGKKRTAKSALRQLHFEVVDGPDKGKKFSFLQKEIIVGRNRGDLPLNDQDVSKRHAEIVVWGTDQIFIRDIESTNGVFVGDKKVDRIQLKNGDRITVGSTELLVAFGEVVAQPRPVGEDTADETTHKRPDKGAISLVVVQGKDKGKRQELKAGKHFIGRDPEGFSLKDMDTSRAHAELVIDKDGRVFLTDLASTNGTFVNGKKVSKVEIYPGDEIGIGKTLIKVE